MNETQRKRFYRQALLAVWAMVTLVLLFTLGLLAYELAGQEFTSRFFSPRTPSEPTSAASSSPAPAAPTREVLLYFGNHDAGLLRPEPRHIEIAGSTVDNCRQALRALIQGPQDILVPVLPAATQIRALYLLENGELVVDLSREIAPEQVHSMSSEALMVYAIANTLCQPALQGADNAQVQTVRLLVEGAPPQGEFPGHIDLAEPYAPDSGWVARQENT